MFKKKKHMVTFADDQSISFLTLHGSGSVDISAAISLDAFLKEGNPSGETTPKGLPSINRLMVVPDYWLGNRVDAFQSRKKSVIAAFIERKIRHDQPELSEASDFYDYAIVAGNDRGRYLYTYYLQESAAYRLYRQLEKVGIVPRRVTTPALLWQARLSNLAQGFGETGYGFIHLGETDCFLYFYFRAQFLFSRTIHLPNNDDDPSEIYNLLNYEINQSFYLYSQKTKSSVDALYMLATDSEATARLTESLGREVRELPGPFFPSIIGEKGWMPPSCRSFSIDDLNRVDLLSIFHQPLKKELYWRPMQWAGVAVGLLLVVLLTLESVYLHSWLTSAERQMTALQSTGPPEAILEQTSLSIDEIRQAFERPSGSKAIFQTLLVLPDAVSIETLSLDLSSAARLSIGAVVHAGDPNTFKTVLRSLLERLNERFQMQNQPLREKDVQIILDRKRGEEKAPVYRIQFQFGIS